MLEISTNIKILFSILATVIVIGGFFLPYLADMFRRRTKPHAYTWLIWSITQGTAVAGLIYGKGGWGAVALVSGTFFCFLIFLLSFKYGTRNITKSDTVVLIAALSAIVVWWQLNSPLLAVFMVSIIDVLGYIPTFRKTFEEPWTEPPIPWVVFSASNIFAILALSEYNLLTLTYIVSITLASVTLLIICLVRRKVIPRET